VLSAPRLLLCSGGGKDLAGGSSGKGHGGRAGRSSGKGVGGCAGIAGGRAVRTGCAGGPGPSGRPGPPAVPAAVTAADPAGKETATATDQAGQDPMAYLADPARKNPAVAGSCAC